MIIRPHSAADSGRIKDTVKLTHSTETIEHPCGGPTGRPAGVFQCHLIPNSGTIRNAPYSLTNAQNKTPPGQPMGQYYFNQSTKRLWRDRFLLHRLQGQHGQHSCCRRSQTEGATSLRTPETSSRTPTTEIAEIHHSFSCSINHPAFRLLDVSIKQFVSSGTPTIANNHIGK